MSRFLVGDELGNIKSLRHQENKAEIKTIHDGSSTGKSKGIQALSIASTSGSKLVRIYTKTLFQDIQSRVQGKLAAGHTDGSASTFILKDDDQLELLHSWKETRFRPDQTFVGLSASEGMVYSCTSNGALRLTTLGQDDTPISHNLGSLPTRLCDWRNSPNNQTFAYGGDEVELSVWDTEKAFIPAREQGEGIEKKKKRKRGDDLFPGEIWRAKNVPNDYLGLRQPVHITSLAYLSPSSSANHHHILTGTQLGDVRRYDIRTARRPVSNWKGIGKIGGIKTVERGFVEHEVFVSDKGCNLFALDLRNGGVLCGYKGLSGAVTSIAPSPTFTASVALDRFARIHSNPLPPKEIGQQVEKKGEVCDKVYTKSIPTVVIWDGDVADNTGITPREEESDSEEEKVWDGMQNVGDSDDEDDTNSRAKRKDGKKSRVA